MLTKGTQRLVVRAQENGKHVTKVIDGTKRITRVSGLSGSKGLNTWTLQAQSWTPGPNQYTSLKTDLPAVPVTADENGKLPSWRDILAPVDLSTASGLGTYTTTIDLPSKWQKTDGAYLALGDVLDTATVTVNGRQVVVNQSDPGRIDLGRLLDPGENTIQVQVATTMFNAVRKSGDSNCQLQEWQHTGLMGPVVLTPYRDTVLQPKKR